MKSQHRRGSRRAPWAVALAIAALTSSIVAGGHAGAGNGLTSDQVADQIIAVQDDADAVAAKLADLDAESQDLAAQIATTQVDVDAAQARYDQLQQDLQAIALSKYTGAIPQSNLPFSGSIMNDVQTDALAGFALGSGQVDLGEVGAAQRDLDRKQQQLASLQGAQRPRPRPAEQHPGRAERQDRQPHRAGGQAPRRRGEEGLRGQARREAPA